MNEIKYIIGIDPGPEKSGVVVWDGQKRYHASHLDNVKVLERLHSDYKTMLAIEMVAHYGKGMAVGRDIFESVRWIGRFEQAFRSEPSWPVRLVYNNELRLHFCDDTRAKGSNIRLALKDRFGPNGTPKNPGPSIDMRGQPDHVWMAFGVAVFAWDTMQIWERDNG